MKAGLVSGVGGQVPEGVSCCFPLASPLVTAGAGAVAVLNLPRPALPCSRRQGTRSRLSCLNGSVSSLGAAAILVRPQHRGAAPALGGAAEPSPAAAARSRWGSAPRAAHKWESRA